VHQRQPHGDVEPDVEGLLRGADVAMYFAKSKGKGRYEFFEQRMNAEMAGQLELSADLQTALERSELFLEYQPIVDLSGGITGVEALLRWRHRQRGLLMPDRFIPLAEETGLIVPIGRWVIREACRQATRWNGMKRGAEPLGISVNLSARQLHDPRLVDDVAQALADTGLEPGLLTLEMTESVLMADDELGRERLERLTRLGVNIAIDDFGMGYSSLSYLQRFPVNVIKIDRSLVRGLSEAGETQSPAIIRSVVDLSSALSLVTVAEGIEDVDQLAALEALGCQRGQGYYFSRPVDAGTLEDLLRRGDSGLGNASRSRALPRTAGATTYIVEVHREPAALDRVGADLDDLHATLKVPVNARRAWLATWANTHEAFEPWVVVVRRRGSRGIEGAALLAARAEESGLAVVGMGHARSGVTALPARPGAEQALADAVVKTLTALNQRWSLTLEQLPAGDPVAAAIAGRLEGARLKPDLRVPRVSLDAGGNLRPYLTRNMHRSLKKARNRLESGGHRVEIAFDRDPGAVAGLLGEIERTHRQRDHDLQRSSDIDEPAVLNFWRRVILQHSIRGEVEIASLRIDGVLASYVVGLLDGSSYRIYDGRFDTLHAHFAPGRLLEAATLERVLSDPSYTELDWWSGLSAEKLLTANASAFRERLTASCPATPATTDDAIADKARNGSGPTVGLDDDRSFSEMV
jgi:EAL domain-containing protein (putative c-di-GMP-specific phosphodiesterase class I)